MDYEAIREQTRKAYADAGEPDVDLSYLTDQYLDDLEGSAQPSTPEYLAEVGVDQESIAAGATYVWAPHFSGSRYTGGVAYANGNCEPNWKIGGVFSHAVLLRKCNQNPLAWIWKLT